MVSAPSILNGINFSLPVIEAFPTSLSILNLNGLERELDEDTIKRLKTLEGQLRHDAPIQKALNARSNDTFQNALAESFQVATGYYVESGVLVWRALEYNYDRLLRLSRKSSAALEKTFFQFVERLEAETFMQTVAGLRVLAKVAQWVVLAEKGRNEGVPPAEYLGRIVAATFYTWCILAYLNGDVKRARKENVEAIARAIMVCAEGVYEDALNDSLPRLAGESQEWYWSPAWQLGEVEADLDIRMNRVESFDSVEDLLEDLQEP